MQKLKAYFEALNYIDSLASLPLKRGYPSDAKKEKPQIYVDRTRHLLNLLGSPDRELKIIHITGTAGKSSVAGLIHSALVENGETAGLFTSPYATSFIEKIKVNNLYISPEEVALLLTEMKPKIEAMYNNSELGRPSQFEIHFILALLYFKKMKTKYAVIEVGCGGRYDATNAVAPPLASAITNIGYDHTSILGKTLIKIAADKAGIIKKGSFFYTTEKRPRLLKIFKDSCRLADVPYLKIGSSQNTHHELNMLLATKICQDLNIGDQAIAAGFKKFRLPCRFEKMQERPKVILDGAHNQNKIRATVANLKKESFKNLHLIFAIAANKEIKKIAAEIAPMADSIAITRFLDASRKCADPKNLASVFETFKKPNVNIEVSLDPKALLDKTIATADKEDIVLVCGSFYLAGDLRKHWYPEEWILKERKSFK